jgi:hypothetical protein
MTPDTILISDTMTIAQVETDTVFYFDSIHDTIIPHKDRLEITLNRIHRTVPVEKIKIVKPDKFDRWFAKKEFV